MTSVLNVGVMPQNPVGNQIRNLQGQLDNSKKDLQMLLLAMEAKAPDVYAEYVRMKDEAAERADSANRSVQQQQQRAVFQPSQPNRSNGRF